MFLLRNARLRLPVLLLALLVTGELSHFPLMTEAYRRKEHCEKCGLEYDNCSPSESAVECEGTSFCFKTYNTSINRLQKGCSNGTTQADWETVIRLTSAWGKQSVCFDATESNLAMIKECQGGKSKSNCTFETVPQINQNSQGAPDISKMTSKKCICPINETAPCNEGDVPGFEEIQRAKVEVNQCYTCSNDTSTPCSDQNGKAEVTEWCRSKYCSFSKKRDRLFRSFLDGESHYHIVYNRGCADHYEDPAKTLECLKGNEGGCMNVKKLRKCSPTKRVSYFVDDYDEKDPGQDMKECICEGNLCNDKLKEEIKLDAGAETSVIFNKKLIILMVPALFEAFCRIIAGLGL